MLSVILTAALLSAQPADSVVLDGPAPRIVVWGARWCVWCKRMESTVQQLESEGWAVEHRDVDRQPAEASRRRITSLPTVCVMRGIVELARATGFQSLDRLREMAKTHGVARRRDPL